MVEQLLDADPVAGVLLQALVQEVAALARHEHIAGDTNLVLHDFDELLLLRYFEGVLPHQHLVHHYPQRPNIDLFVVLLAPQYLGTDVERSAAEGGPEAVVLVD